MRWIAFDPVYSHPLPPGHRFPMIKYEMIPAQLLYEGTISESNLFSPSECSRETVLLTHTEEYLDKLLHQKLSASEQRHIGFPQSPALTRRELVITQGTVDCCAIAKVTGIAMNVAGGTHHAFKDRGEGFCLLNDFAVAANAILHDQHVNQVLIIDLDVHQGNGTANIFHNDPRVFTLSIHGQHNYPFRKEKSDLDIGLQDGIGDDEYFEILVNTIPDLIERIKPQFIFYLSGVDVLATDKFGKLKLSLNGCRTRDEFVLSLVHQRNIPCVVAMGGGYSEDTRVIVDAHCNTFRLAKKIFDLH